ncbi:hypothetical protein [Lysobacter capsici]|uniref:hypothetical protein n=1 Tax=Lysobacter capsici TaxID=435897 RepID=UPI000627F8B4|nr:hypothetical protein [Lysobacter capsici]
MGKNSKKRRDAKLRKKKQSDARIDIHNPTDRAIFMRELKALIANLTTPAEVSDRVIKVSAKLSDQAPVYLECQPEKWSRQSCCDKNVLEYAKIHGGESVFGFRLWSNGDIYIEAERHAVWRNGDTFRDVSFVDTGETRVLFVPDSPRVVGGFEAAPPRQRFAFTPRHRQVIAALNYMETLTPRHQMTSDESWEVMPSYEEWQAGKRMPNLIPAVRQRFT